MGSDNWQKDLRKLRGRFEYEARVRPGVDLHMMEADTGFHGKLNAAPLKYKPGFDDLTDRGPYGTVRLERGDHVKRVWWLLFEDDANDSLYLAEIASLAGTVVAGKSVRGVCAESLSGNACVENWFWTVLDLALNNNAKDALYTRRYLWGGHGSSQWIKPCDLRLGGLTDQSVQNHPAMRCKQKNGAPALWYSRLTGIARASVLAIDQILGCPRELSEEIAQEHPREPLNANEIAILTYLAEPRNRGRLLVQVDIAAGSTVKGVGISLRSMKNHIPRLENRGYIVRPRGRKMGYQITALGDRVLKSVS